MAACAGFQMAARDVPFFSTSAPHYGDVSGHVPLQETAYVQKNSETAGVQRKLRSGCVLDAFASFLGCV